MNTESQKEEDIEDLGYVQCEAAGLPRWVTIPVGILLAPLATLCLAGSVLLILGKVGNDSLLIPVVGVAMALVSVWALNMCWQLVSGREAKGGPTSSRMYTLISWAFALLILFVLFSGQLLSEPLVSSLRIVGFATLFLVFRAAAANSEANAAELGVSFLEENSMSRNSVGLSGWFFGIFGFAMVGGLFWNWSPWAFGVFTALVLYFLTKMFIENRQARIRGYSVEYMSPYIYGGGENEGAIDYREGENWILFKTLERGKNDRDLVYVPSAKAWDEEMRPWAKGRRAEIVGRIAKDKIMRNRVIVESEDR